MAGMVTRFFSAALASTLSLAAAADSYDFQGGYTADILYNFSGGLETGARYLDNIDLSLEIDMAEAWGAGSSTLFIYALYNNGTTFSDELVGDLQVISNIDAPRAWRIYELWYQFSQGPWSLRAGLYDLNSEFDVNETGSLFINSSHGIGPEFSQTGQNGPSIFPVSSLTARGAWQTDRVSVRLAVLDGVPGDPEDPASNKIDLGGDQGVLIVGEVESRLYESGRIWLGFWRYTAEFERQFSAGSSGGNDGWYLGAERDFELGRLAASAFVRYGQANDEINVLRDYIGAGVAFDSPFKGRGDDRFGIAVASAGAGSGYRNFLDQAGILSMARETNWELTYRARVSRNLTIQPNLQFVSNPSASNAVPDAWVAGIRFEVTAGLP